jgi:hypothetical protein
MKELQKLDILRKRMKVNYSQAKEALDQCDEDLVQALVYLEKKGFAENENDAPFFDEDERELKWDKEKTENFARGIVEQVKSFVQEGNVTKVRLIRGEKVLIEIPATVGVVGIGIMLFSPLLFVLTAIGAATAVAQEMVFELEKADGTVERRNLKFPTFGGKKAEESKDEDCGCEDEDCDCEDDDCDCEDEDCDCDDDAKEAGDGGDGESSAGDNQIWGNKNE